MDIAFTFLFKFLYLYFTAAKGKLQQKPAGGLKNGCRRADFFAEVPASSGKENAFVRVPFWRKGGRKGERNQGTVTWLL
jgi:hypothetical protein